MTDVQTPSISDELRAPRIASIDIFRGLTMAVMIFVNDLDGVHGLPWWTHHAKANIDLMTYVDMVFPFFLFLVGLSMPIAVRQRLKKNPSMFALWLHVAFRSIALIALGLILANASKASAALMPLDPNVWALLTLLGLALFLSVYPGDGRYARLHFRMRIFGLGVAVVMLALFRRSGPDGHVAWIDFSYPEILGLIGCTYFAASLVFIPMRRWPWTPLVSFIALLAFSIACAAKWLVFERGLLLYVWPFGDGTMAFITMAGVVTSMIFLGQRPRQTLRYKILLGILFGLSCLAVGRALTPLGISKIRDTPTWGLYSVGAAVLLFTALFWLCDLKRKTTWAKFVLPAGANTLVTYLLPDIWFFLASILGFTWFESHCNAGLPGVVRAAIFTASVLWLAGILYRRSIRIQV